MVMGENKEVGYLWLVVCGVVVVCGVCMMVCGVVESAQLYH